jgi:hypothetical protein
VFMLRVDSNVCICENVISSSSDGTIRICKSSDLHCWKEL